MPVTRFKTPEKYRYLDGFGSYHQTEALAGANPIGANSPQLPVYDLCTERISGSSFTSPRAQNLQTWLYRVHSSLDHEEYVPYSKAASPSIQGGDVTHTPNALKWGDFEMEPGHDWVTGQHLVAQAGDIPTKTGLSYLVYGVTEDMEDRSVFFSSDGDYLVVPQAGTLDVRTELGNLLVRPNEIVVIPRGIRYQVTLPDGPARGYICELYQGHFQLPELGPIGSCSLANARDFQVPIANFSGEVLNGIATTVNANWTILTKYTGKLFSCEQNHSPFDIAAWHGTYYPYKYDLGRYSVLGSTLYDHPDPSIFTVLTAPSHREPGTAVVDFAIFPPRWLVMEDTYWPPYFHRNTMSEFAGVILQVPDHSKDLRFKPFGASLNSSMVPHGMDKATHEHARRSELKPTKTAMEGLMVFLFESEAMMGVTGWGMQRAVTSDKPISALLSQKPRL